MQSQEAFHQLSAAAISNKQQQELIAQSDKQFDHKLGSAKEQYANLELAKERAAYYKWKVVESLDKYLIEFEANLLRRGGKIIWAVDAASALEEIQQIIKRVEPKTIIRSHSRLAEEIGLPNMLIGKAPNVLAGNIGDYINEKLGSSTFHMVNPIMNKTPNEIATQLNDKIGVSLEAAPNDIALDIRNEVRNKFSEVDIAITGANFLISETGMVALSENEGNIRLALSYAKTQIIIAGIDKMIPTMNDLDIYFPLLATYGSGQKLTAYNSIVGPRQPGELDGPAEFIVILVDNGRSDLLAQADQRQALSCIGCGACSRVCPVFSTIGGNAFEDGPIGAVTYPHMHGMKELNHLSYASTLCGNCTDICPVKIDLHNHLLRNRRDSVIQGNIKSSDKMMWFSWKKMMLSRKNLNKSASVKNFILKSFLKSAWGEQREFPKVVDKSFNQLWRERNGL